MKITKILTSTLIIVLILIAIEVARWYVAGTRGSWIILSDPFSDSVVVATDLDSFKLLLAIHPSKTWALYDQLHLSEGTRDRLSSDSVAFDRAKKAGRIKYLPNNTRAEELRELEIDKMLAGAANNGHSPHALAIEFRVRKGPYRGLKGWTIPELIQHEIAWP